MGRPVSNAVVQTGWRTGHKEDGEVEENSPVTHLRGNEKPKAQGYGAFQGNQRFCGHIGSWGGQGRGGLTWTRLKKSGDEKVIRKKVVFGGAYVKRWNRGETGPFGSNQVTAMSVDEDSERDENEGRRERSISMAVTKIHSVQSGAESLKTRRLRVIESWTHRW